MRRVVLLLTLFSSVVFADDYSLRAAYGRADHSYFSQIISGNTAPYSTHSDVLMLSGGYNVVKNAFDLPLDFYINFGIARFLEGQSRTDIYENTLFLKGYYTFHILKEPFRFGVGEGASYTYGTLYVEKLNAEVNDNGPNSNFLNYLDFSLDCDMGKLLSSKPLEKTYLGVALKHRSGIFGLINNVRYGGSNYELIYLEKSF